MRFEMPKDAMTRDALYLGAMVAAVGAAGFWVLGGWNFPSALVGGLGLGAAVILVMMQLELRIREDTATGEAAQHAGQGAPTPAPSTDTAPAAAPSADPEPPTPTPEPAPAVKAPPAADIAAAPDAAPAGKETPAEDTAAVPEAAPAEDTAPAAKTVPVEDPAPAQDPAPAPAPAATPDPAPAVAAEATKPVGLEAAPEGGGDDLKLIKGVGPKLETLLQDLGIYSFAQIAGWSAAEVAWMDDNLKGFRGRVSRDDWIGQAKALAAGETTEFAARVKEGGVY